MRVGEQTDIWNIGAAIWDLMAGNPNSGQGPIREDVPPQFHQPVFAVPVGHMHVHSLFSGRTAFPQGVHYSDQLKQVVGWCLEYHAQHRPNVDQLDDWADDFLENHTDIRDDMTPPAAVLPAVDAFQVGATLPAKYRH